MTRQSPICPTENAPLPSIPKRLRCRQLLGSLELFLDQQCLPYAVLLKKSLLVDAVMNEISPADAARQGCR